jgi:TolB-like protein/Tfp pilus assembly protein PilF
MSDKPSFFSELKRRNVYKVAVAYAVVGWLIAQIATQIFPFLEIPNWVVRLVIVLIAIGFPIALVIAWAFEATPEGIKRTETADAMPATARHKKHAWIYIVVIGAAISVTLFFLGRYTAGSKATPRPASEQLRRDGQSEAATGSPISNKSVAVLPFENLSSDKENAYFAQGIQDEILTRLAKIGALKVISRTSTSHFASSPQNLPEIARQLGVANILEGSVQKARDAVHVNVQLIRAATDDHLWAESYDRQLDDIFGVEKEVAQSIASALNAKLTGAEEKAVADKPTQNLAAYDAYLRGVSLESIGNTSEQAQQVAADFAEAVRLDPKFAVAWARLALTRSYLYFNGLDLTANSAAAVKDAADRAFALQPDLGESWLAQGVYRYRVLRDFAGALQSYLEALKRLPNSSLVFEHLGHVERRLGKAVEAEKHYEMASQLDPRNIRVLSSMADISTTLRQFDAANATLDRILEISPGDASALAAKAINLQNSGRLDESAKVVRQITKHPNDPTVALAITLQFIYQHQWEDAIAAIQRSITKEPDPRSILLLGQCQESAGKRPEARETFERVIAAIKPSSDSVVPIDARQLPCFLAWAYAGLGDKNKAVEEARQAVDDYSNDGLPKPFTEFVLASIEARFGEIDAAISALPHLLEVPNGLTRAQLRMDPLWDPLRKDPRFQKLCEERGK